MSCADLCKWHLIFQDFIYLNFLVDLFKFVQYFVFSYSVKMCSRLALWEFVLIKRSPFLAEEFCVLCWEAAIFPSGCQGIAEKKQSDHIPIHRLYDKKITLGLVWQNDFSTPWCKVRLNSRSNDISLFDMRCSYGIFFLIFLGAFNLMLIWTLHINQVMVV